MATPTEQLAAMRGLGKNWDGYDAAAPQVNVIDLAQELVGLIEEMRERRAAAAGVLHVSPTRVGGILIEWQDGLVEHEVDINPDRSIGFLHHNPATGQIETRQFSPEPTVVQAGFLHELRQLLAA